MVRVIPVHNFLGQNVSQIEEPSAACVINTLGRETLLLALPTHCVAVHDLTVSNLELTAIFPTVDVANKILHCERGDYVATLESKVSRDGANTNNFVRIYVNWKTTDGQGQAMRARIAGRVTPSLNRPMNSLEMIELPLNARPTTIACCQATGNLLVATGNSAILHAFKIETQQHSKLKFIDFEARPWSLEFSFSPTHMEIAEDFISIMDATHFHIFRLTNSMYKDINELVSLSSTDSSSLDKTSLSANSSPNDSINKTANQSDRVDTTPTINSTYESSRKAMDQVFPRNNSFARDLNLRNTSKNLNQNRLSSHSTIDRTMSQTNATPYLDWDHLIRNEREETQRLISRGMLDATSSPLTVNLPSISLERAGLGHASNPFVLNPSGMYVTIKTTLPDNGWSENYTVKSLLSLKISNVSTNSNVVRSSECFTCLELKPLYLKQERDGIFLMKSILQSDRFQRLNGATCLIATSQEGYVYHFSVENYDDYSASCLAVYPFTMPVKHVAMDHTVLHALTEAGLESYTMRLSHHVAQTLSRIDHSKMPCPEVSEPVCLIGLRPFLGVEKLMCAGNCLVLLAKDDNSWTLYSLIVPTVENIYLDILGAAKNHKSSSPSTYRHLLGEAHAILRLAKDVHRGVTPIDANRQGILEENGCDKLNNLYNQSCALLADYYIRSNSENDWNLCVLYYRMSGLKAAEVLSRKSVIGAPGLVPFLTQTLISLNSGSEADALFQSHNVVAMLSSENTEDISKLILRSPVLREYATEKLINILTVQEPSDSILLALVLLYLQTERQEEAEKALRPTSERFLKKIASSYWQLLFDLTAIKKKSRAVPTFSEFSGILMRQRRKCFAEVLSSLIADGVLSLHQVMRIFLEYLPSRVGRNGNYAAAALQLFIETHLRNYFNDDEESRLDAKCGADRDDFATTEALKILVRSYLSILAQNRTLKTETVDDGVDCNETENNRLYANVRPRYLDKMPPYARDYQKILGSIDLKDLADVEKNESKATIPSELFKLQGLLASGYLPEDSLQEVQRFLESHNVIGSLALKTLCEKNTERVTQMLMEDCPQAVLQYAKNRYTKECEWKYLIELLLGKISMAEEDREPQYCLFDQLVKETLTYLAQTLPLSVLRQILPNEDQTTFQRYTDICNQIVTADHVKSLIIETGHQLLSTLNP